MSALTAPESRQHAVRPGNGHRATKAGSAPRLTPVATGGASLARLPFLLVLAGLLVIGMVGVLVLNTQLQSQAFGLRNLQRQAAELGYEQAALQSQLDATSSVQNLTRRASELGMRPNPYPVFIELPSGTVLGQPRRVSGNELSFLVHKSGAQLRAEQQHKRATAEYSLASGLADAVVRRIDAQEAAKQKAAQEKAAKEKATRAAKEKAAREKATREKAAKAQAAKTAATTASSQPDSTEGGH